MLKKCTVSLSIILLVFFSIYGSIGFENEGGSYINGVALGASPVPLNIIHIRAASCNNKAIVTLVGNLQYKFDITNEYGKMMFNLAISAYMDDKKVYIQSHDDFIDNAGMPIFYEIWATNIMIVNSN